MENQVYINNCCERCKAYVLEQYPLEIILDAWVWILFVPGAIEVQCNIKIFLDIQYVKARASGLAGILTSSSMLFLSSALITIPTSQGSERPIHVCMRDVASSNLFPEYCSDDIH